MTLRPGSIEELRHIAATEPRVRVRGHGTKPGLSGVTVDETVIDLSALAGIVEHTPEECTFTALAGTPVAEIERLLAAHGQYLPFDPPLVDAGATIGGTVAAGASGSCRYRFGGIRDFLIGARIVDGRGQLVTSGGKVVKNAAGFLLHQGLIGSCGRLGILAELTFKVFPRAQAWATVKVSVPDLQTALDAMTSVQRGRFDLEALDLESPSTVWIRLGGLAEALPSRIAAMQRCLDRDSDVLQGEDDAEVWHRAREFSWVSPDAMLVRVPLTRPLVAPLDSLVARSDSIRRYTLAGNVALIAWRGSLDELSLGLASLELKGQVLIGPSGRSFIGAVAPSEFERRLRTVMDPDCRFGTGN
jgi:glycolate oxidase FAD binding subunit